MNVPREANVPVQTADESVFELSIVTQSYGTPSVSATIWLCIVFEPLPMSTVPEKTSTRPSGLILIQAWIGSPFWFIPVGYSIARDPATAVLGHQAAPFRRPLRVLLGHEVLAGADRRSAARGVICRYSAGSSCPSAPRREVVRHGGGVCERDPVRRSCRRSGSHS